MNHARSARGQDQLHRGMPHQLIGELDGRLVDAPNDVLRSACRYRSPQHQTRRHTGGPPRARMRADDDPVARLQADQCLEDRRRGRIRRRNNTADQAHRFGDGDGARFVVLAQNAAGLLVLVLVVDVLRGEVVLDHLVFHHAHPRLFHGQLSQRNARIGGGQRGAAEDGVNLLLREAGKFLLSGLDACNQGVQFFRGGDPVFGFVVRGKKHFKICHALLFLLLLCVAMKDELQVKTAIHGSPLRLSRGVERMVYRSSGRQFTDIFIPINIYLIYGRQFPRTVIAVT